MTSVACETIKHDASLPLLHAIPRFIKKDNTHLTWLLWDRLMGGATRGTSRLESFDWNSCWCREKITNSASTVWKTLDCCLTTFSCPTKSPAHLWLLYQSTNSNFHFCVNSPFIKKNSEHEKQKYFTTFSLTSYIKAKTQHSFVSHLMSRCVSHSVQFLLMFVFLSLWVLISPCTFVKTGRQDSEYATHQSVVYYTASN